MQIKPIGPENAHVRLLAGIARAGTSDLKGCQWL
jgi:hypothetical protein